MKLIGCLLLVVCMCLPLAAQESSAAKRHPATFHNPLLPTGPDPWVEYKDGFYYYMNTTEKNLTLWKTRNMADLKSADKKVIWIPPASGPYSHDIWAPEIHFLEGKWYIYFGADAAKNDTHRIWCWKTHRLIPCKVNGRSRGRLPILRTNGRSIRR